MTKEEQYIEIGYTKKTRGINGEVKVFVKDEYFDDFLEAGVLFIDVQGGYVPFFVESIRETNALLLKFEDINSPEEAAPVTGKPFYMRASDLRAPQSAPPTDFSLLRGFRIVDLDSGPVGPIREILELPQQIMAVVEYGDGEVLIPLNDQLITGIDEEAQILEMDLPEGLLELF